MSACDWGSVVDALDRCQAENRIVDVWLRDDDAIAATPRLERLAAVAERTGMPVLLAVIPEGADGSLARFVADRALLHPTQHGYRHRNHAAPGERARELGGRSVREVLEELARGRERLQSLFGPRLSDIMVPPWNRIDAEILAGRWSHNGWTDDGAAHVAGETGRSEGSHR